MEDQDRPVVARLRATLRGGSRPSPSYWLLADYALQHPDHVAFKTARELGESVGVSEATVIRFAHYLGYPGFPEFQRDCQEMLSDELARAREMRRRLMPGGTGETPDSPAEIVGTAAQAPTGPGGQPGDAPGALPAAAQSYVVAPRRVTDYLAYQASQMVDSDVPMGGFGEGALD